MEHFKQRIGLYQIVDKRAQSMKMPILLDNDQVAVRYFEKIMENASDKEKKEIQIYHVAYITYDPENNKVILEDTEWTPLN